MNNIAYFESLHDPAINSTLKLWSNKNNEAGVFVLVAETDKDFIPDLQQTFRKENCPMIGAVFPALVLDDSFVKRGVLLLRFRIIPECHIIPALSLQKNSEHSVAKSISDSITVAKSDVKSSLFLVFDVMIPKIESILEELYFQLGDRVDYMGVNAGSETFQPISCLFDNNQLVQDAILAVLLPNNTDTILKHGYRAPKKIVSATTGEGNLITSINWRPALEVYSDLVMSQYGVKINRENFYEMSVHFPFGVLLTNRDILVRIPVALKEDGSIFCAGELPEKSVLVLLNEDQTDSEDTINTLAQHFIGSNEENILLFYCAGRRLHLGEISDRELKTLNDKLKPMRTAGALSLGEIGSSYAGGDPMLHNAALSGSVWNN